MNSIEKGNQWAYWLKTKIETYTFYLKKGAAEILLKKSNQFMSSNWNLVKLSDNDKSSVNEQLIDNFMKKSLRTLAICIKEDLPELKGFKMTYDDLREYFMDMKNFA